MVDLVTIQGALTIKKQILVRLLAMLNPTPLTAECTMFHAGYEAAKRDMSVILADQFGQDFSLPVSERIIRELRSK